MPRTCAAEFRPKVLGLIEAGRPIAEASARSGRVPTSLHPVVQQFGRMLHWSLTVVTVA